MTSQPRLLSLKQVALELGMSYTKCYQQELAGLFPIERQLGQAGYFYARSKVDAYIEDNRITNPRHPDFKPETRHYFGKRKSA